MDHGLHTFNPEFIVETFKANHFEIVYLKFSSSQGTPLLRPQDAENSLIWIVGKKKQAIENFNIYQQATWPVFYGNSQQSSQRRSFLKDFWNYQGKSFLRLILPPILVMFYFRLCFWIRTRQKGK